MRLHELDRLIERFGPLATLGEIRAVLANEAENAARAPAPRGLADSDHPGTRCTCRNRGDYLDCPIHKFPPSDA